MAVGEVREVEVGAVGDELRLMSHARSCPLRCDGVFDSGQTTARVQGGST